MCLWLCTTLVHNTTQNSSDNLPSYLQTNIIAQMLSIGGEVLISYEAIGKYKNLQWGKCRHQKYTAQSENIKCNNTSYDIRKIEYNVYWCNLTVYGHCLFVLAKVCVWCHINCSDLLYHKWAKMANTKWLPTYFFKIQVTIFLKKNSIACLYVHFSKSLQNWS